MLKLNMQTDISVKTVWTMSFDDLNTEVQGRTAEVCRKISSTHPGVEEKEKAKNAHYWNLKLRCCKAKASEVTKVS